MRIRKPARRFPPVLVLGLLLMWLLLNQTVAPGHVLLGAALAFGVTWITANLRPLQPTLSSLRAAPALLAVVLVEILRSNFSVARIVLGLAGGQQVKSGFLEVPLDMRDPHGIAVLAAILTANPGTVWVDLTRDNSKLTLHLLDLRDEDEWIRRIKERFEKPLMRIFE